MSRTTARDTSSVMSVPSLLSPAPAQASRLSNAPNVSRQRKRRDRPSAPPMDQSDSSSGAGPSSSSFTATAVSSFRSTDTVAGLPFGIFTRLFHTCVTQSVIISANTLTLQGSSPVDIQRLFHEVHALGGFESVNFRARWQTVADSMGYAVPPAVSKSSFEALADRLKLIYATHLTDFEENFPRYTEAMREAAAKLRRQEEQQRVQEKHLRQQSQNVEDARNPFDDSHRAERSRTSPSPSRSRDASTDDRRNRQRSRVSIASLVSGPSSHPYAPLRPSSRQSTASSGTLRTIQTTAARTLAPLRIAKLTTPRSSPIRDDSDDSAPSTPHSSELHAFRFGHSHDSDDMDIDQDEGKVEKQNLLARS